MTDASTLPRRTRALLASALAAALVLLTGPAARAQTATLAVVAESVRVGAPFAARLTVLDARGPLVLPRSGPVGRGDVEVVRAGPVATYDGVGGRRDSVELTLAVYALDSVDVALPVGLVVGAETVRVATLPVRLRVERLVADSTARLRPTRPPATFGWPPWVWLALAALVALVVFAFVRRRRPASPVPAPAAPALDLTARQRLAGHLDALAATLPRTPAEAREWSGTLVDGLRAYLGDRFGYSTREMTTADLVRTLRRAERRGTHPTGSADALGDLLGVVDIGRYGGVCPPDYVLRTALVDTAALADRLDRTDAPEPRHDSPPSTSSTPSPRAAPRPGARPPLPTPSVPGARAADARAADARTADARTAGASRPAPAWTGLDGDTTSPDVPTPPTDGSAVRDTG